MRLPLAQTMVFFTLQSMIHSLFKSQSVHPYLGAGNHAAGTRSLRQSAGNTIAHKPQPLTRCMYLLFGQ